MALGSVIAFSEDSNGRSFMPISAISHRRSDPSSFNECLLQELVDATPCVLPVREYLPSSAALFSLGREVPVDLGAGQGFIDNLLVTNDGYLVIVETKLYRNPEGIREVIAQTLQYGMAICQMQVMELEARVRRGMSPALVGKESIRDCVYRQASEPDKVSALADDFEEALERHLRRGEVLLLVVSDSIHVGVERVGHWLNDQGNSSPFKFGLVELKFYTHGNDRLVFPRTVLKTREISRHTVVVDIRPSVEKTLISAEVIDEYRTSTGGSVQESRAVKSAQPMLTKTTLLQRANREDSPVIAELIEELESYGFDQRGTNNYLQFGFMFPQDDGEFHPLCYVGTSGLWTQALKPLRLLMTSDELREFHVAANQLAIFYRPDQVDVPHSMGCAVKYSQIRDKLSGYVAFLDSYRTRFVEKLEGSV